MTKKDLPVDAVCLKCGVVYDELHELFGGGVRKFSIKNNIQIPVCRYCHDILQRMADNGAEWVCKKFSIDYNELRLHINNLYIENRKEYFKLISRIFYLNIKMFCCN